MQELLIEIEIPNYPDKIQVSKARRPVFYVSENSSVRGRKSIPKSYLNMDKYYFDSRGILYSKSTELPQLANPRTAGNPRYIIINGQDIWNGKLNKFGRNNITIALKKILIPYFENISKIEEFPISIRKFILSPTMKMDVDNKSTIYTKVISDILTELEIIPDDKARYINENGGLKWVQSEESKMIIRIYKSDNLIE